MTIGFIKTDGGPHTAAEWAEATASHIVSIADHVYGKSQGQALKLQAAIVDILEDRHAKVQDGERDKIATDGHDRLQAPLDPDHHVSVDSVVQEIVKAVSVTPWAQEFDKPETVPHLKALLSSHFATSMFVERSWHADRNPGTEQAKQFKDTFHSGAK